MKNIQMIADFILTLQLRGDRDVLQCETLREVFEIGRRAFGLPPVSRQEFIDLLLREIPHENAMTLTVVAGDIERKIDLRQAYDAMMSNHARLQLEQELCIPGSLPPRLLPGGKPGLRAQE